MVQLQKPAWVYMNGEIPQGQAEIKIGKKLMR